MYPTTPQRQDTMLVEQRCPTCTCSYLLPHAEHRAVCPDCNEPYPDRDTPRAPAATPKVAHERHVEPKRAAPMSLCYLRGGDDGLNDRAPDLTLAWHPQYRAGYRDGLSARAEREAQARRALRDALDAEATRLHPDGDPEEGA